jgi:hypothetical protein
MEPITPEIAAQIKTKLTRLNLWKKKESLVAEFSFNNSVRIGELTKEEADKLMLYLNDLLDRSDRQRKRLLSVGYQMHWDKPRTAAEQMMDNKRLNFNHVNDWLAKDQRSKFKLPMHRLDPFQLTEAVQQLELILDATKAEIKKKYA